MEENGNFLHLSGVLTDNPVYGHEVFGEKFYYATLSVPRSWRWTVSSAATTRSSRARDACSSRASRSIWLTRTATRTRIRCS